MSEMRKRLKARTDICNIEDMCEFYDDIFERVINDLYLRLRNTEFQQWLKEEGFRRIEDNYHNYDNPEEAWMNHGDPGLLFRDMAEELADATVYTAMRLNQHLFTTENYSITPDVIKNIKYES